MPEQLNTLGEVPCILTEPWEPKDLEIPDYFRLGINPDSYGGHISGSAIEVFNRSVETFTVGVYKRFTGLVFYDTETGTVAVGQLSKEMWDIDQFLKSQEIPTVKEVFLISGSQSEDQSDLETILLEQYFGPVKLEKISVDSGTKSWGFVFNSTTGRLKTYTRDDPSEIRTYPLILRSASRPNS